MKLDTVTKINGYGTMFRFITPVLITVGIFVISGLKNDIERGRSEATANFDKLEAVAQINFDKLDHQMSNHLTHHMQFDKEIFERLTAIETKIKK